MTMITKAVFISSTTEMGPVESLKLLSLRSRSVLTRPLGRVHVSLTWTPDPLPLHLAQDAQLLRAQFWSHTAGFQSCLGHLLSEQT